MKSKLHKRFIKYLPLHGKPSEKINWHPSRALEMFPPPMWTTFSRQSPQSVSARPRLFSCLAWWFWSWIIQILCKIIFFNKQEKGGGYPSNKFSHFCQTFSLMLQNSLYSLKNEKMYAYYDRLFLNPLYRGFGGHPYHTVWEPLDFSTVTINVRIVC